MLAGPAALTTVTMLMNQSDTQAEAAIVYLAIALTGCVTYAALRMAEPLHSWLARIGIQVFSRLLGLVLLAISIQFVLDGVRGVRWNVP